MEGWRQTATASQTLPSPFNKLIVTAGRGQKFVHRLKPLSVAKLATLLTKGGNLGGEEESETRRSKEEEEDPNSEFHFFFFFFHYLFLFTSCSIFCAAPQVHPPTQVSSPNKLSELELSLPPLS